MKLKLQEETVDLDSEWYLYHWLLLPLYYSIWAQCNIPSSILGPSNHQISVISPHISVVMRLQLKVKLS